MPDLNLANKKVRKKVDGVLRNAYPQPAEDERTQKMCVALAKRIHRARGAKSKFPDRYDEKAVEKLRSSR